MRFFLHLSFMIIVLAGLFASCAPKPAEELSFDYVAESVNTSLPIIDGGALDADSGERLMDFYTEQNLVGCTATVNRTSGAYSTSGQVTKSFKDNDSNNDNCALDINGEELIRTATIRVTTPSLKLTSTSEEAQNWEGTTIGGGIKILRNSSSDYELTILGMNKSIKTPAGAELVNVSVKTSSAIHLNSIARGDRQIESGTLMVYHNVAQFNAKHVFRNLRWDDSSCCYPTSGTITSTFTRGVEGSATVRFLGCEDAYTATIRVAIGDDSDDIEIKDNCE